MSMTKTESTKTDARTVEPMLTLTGVKNMLSAGRRSVERLRSQGKFPKPDLHIGVSPRWRVSTINRWIDQQADRN